MIHVTGRVEELQETMNNAPLSWRANYRCFMSPASKIE
jgi:hypothetical protein